MPSLKVEFDEGEFKHLQEVLKYVPNGARIAMSTAINKTLATARSKISAKVAALMTARKSSVDKRISVQKSTRESLLGFIRINGSRGVSLIGFGAKQTSSGVTTTEMGRQVDYPGMFIAKGLSGNLLVFERVGEKRIMTKGNYQGKMKQPLSAQYGPSVVKMFNETPGLEASVMTDIHETLEKNLKSQVDWLLERGKAQGD